MLNTRLSVCTLYAHMYDDYNQDKDKEQRYNFTNQDSTATMNKYNTKRTEIVYTTENRKMSS